MCTQEQAEAKRDVAIGALSRALQKAVWTYVESAQKYRTARPHQDGEHVPSLQDIVLETLECDDVPVNLIDLILAEIAEPEDV